MPESEGQIGAPQGRLTPAQAEVLLAGVEALPTLPSVAARVLHLAARDARTERASPELRQVMGCDPALAANLLARAARAGSGQGPADLADELVLSAALSARAFEGLDEGDLEELREVWRHCLTVACAARLLRSAPRAHGADPFLCGLLHDLGTPAMWACLPKSCSRAARRTASRTGAILEHERQVMGVDHTIFGRRLAERWGLPAAVQEAAWLHHQPIDALPQTLADRETLLAVIRAETLVRAGPLALTQEGACSDEYSLRVPPPPTAPAAGDAFAADLAAQVEQLAAVLDLDKPQDPRDYHAALREANAALAEWNQRLRSRHEQTSAGAAAMELLGEFARSLRAEAPPGELLARIARAMAGAGSPPGRVVAYCLSPDDRAVLAVCPDGSELAPWRTAALRAGFDAAWTATGRSVREVLEALLDDPADLSEWVSPTDGCHQELSCAGRWVGGVIWTAEPPQEVLRAGRDLAPVLGLALGIARGRARAVLLSEQLAASSQALAETQAALADAKAAAAVADMAAGAAHEINNPLAVISGRAQLMVRRAESDESRKVWQLIAEEAQRISDIMTALMDAMRPRAPVFERLDAGAMLRSAKEAFASSGHPQAGAVTVDIEAGDAVPALRGDRRQLEAALVELIANAATAAAGKPVRVRLSADVGEDGRTVLLGVSDDGPGMDEKTASQAFTPFFSAQAAGRRVGMGLPKVKRCAEINGGRVWLRSRVGQGTTVCLELPAAGPEERHDGPQTDSSARGG